MTTFTDAVADGAQPDNVADNAQLAVEKRCAYSLVFDNVNKHLHAKETTSQKQNEMKNMVQGYAAVDRIPSMHLDNTAATPAEVAEFEISKFLPSEQEIDILR